MTITALIEKHPELVTQRIPPSGSTLLGIAASHGQRDVAAVLLANHADVNATDVDGWTPLHRAAWHGHRDVVELLLTNHANINAMESRGWTPLDAAQIAGNGDVADVLATQHAEANRSRRKSLTERGEGNGVFGVECNGAQFPYVTTMESGTLYVPSRNYVLDIRSKTVNSLPATIDEYQVQWRGRADEDAGLTCSYTFDRDAFDRYSGVMLDIVCGSGAVGPIVAGQSSARGSTWCAKSQKLAPVDVTPIEVRPTHK